jgi:hypothetical protein
MLEPSTPAGEPFETPQEEENKTSADFESVCISLVERGWKIMPKKGTYPINKKGPRYVNLVDPRGNRKSVRVTNENLWEKLRAAEMKRTQRKSEEPETSKPVEVFVAPTSELKEVSIVECNPEAEGMVDSIESAAQTSLSAEPQAIAPPVEVPAESASAIIQTASIVEEKVVSETSVLSVQQETTIPAIPAAIPPDQLSTKAEIVENPPKEFESFALSSPGLQKSIFDLGFETLLNVLQKETLSPAEIVSKIQEWSTESRNLLEFVHKWQEKNQQPVALPDTSEKDELISELQRTLKETEDKLAEILESSQEI